MATTGGLGRSCRLRSGWLALLLAVVVAAVGTPAVAAPGTAAPGTAAPGTAAAATTAASPTSTGTAWLEELNGHRALAGLPPLVERPSWNRAAEQHARYALAHQVMEHDEDPSLPLHTEEGRWATRTGNLYMSTRPLSPEQAIRGWINSPGHGRWILHWAVSEVGYGQHIDAAQPYSWFAVLPIVGSYDHAAPMPGTYTFPAGGSTVLVHPDERWSSLRTVHLFDPALCVGTDASARVTVDGRAAGAHTAHPGAHHLAVVLDDALPPHAEVRVEVTATGVDGRSIDAAWVFTTTSTPAEAGPGSGDDAPDADGGGDRDGDPSRFSDTAGTTHAAAIDALVERGVTGGFPDGTFRPGAAVTRGQVATFLMRALALEPSGDGFVDTRGTTHDEGVRAVQAAGITGGYADGTFRPEQPVTRAHVAAFLARALDLDPADPGFRDCHGTPHAGSIGAILAEGITGGFPDGTFRPEDTLTRGQMASFLVRALDA